MKAVYISKPGGPEALEVREVPSPVPGPGEVLIDVVAAGLNRADVQQRKGHYPPPPGASEVPGLEVSGRIAGFGPGVTKPFSVGDKVVALLAGGGYAQQVAVPAGQVLKVPDGVDVVTAASLPEVAATVYSNLIMTAQLQPGETVLIHGATGGIGTMAIQLAKAFGAVVAATAAPQRRSAPPRHSSVRTSRSTTPRRTSRRACARRMAARARTSSWTSSGPSTSRRTWTRWRTTGAWS